MSKLKLSSTAGKIFIKSGTLLYAPQRSLTKEEKGKIEQRKI